jgi:hypothetical protein
MEHENTRWRLSSSKNRIRALCNYTFNTINNDPVTEEEPAIAIGTDEVVIFAPWLDGCRRWRSSSGNKGVGPFPEKNVQLSLRTPDLQMNIKKKPLIGPV